MTYEIDALMRVDAGGVIVAEGTGKANQARLEEWLRTPQGSVYGLPSWGNTLADFKHEPTGDDKSVVVAVGIENALLTKLRVDLPMLRISQVRCEVISEDMFSITFVMPDGELTLAFKKNS